VKARVAALLVFCILLAYTIPIFYETILETRLLKVSRLIAVDMMDARGQALSSRANYGILFESGDTSSYKIFLDKNSNRVLDNQDTLIREVKVEEISPGIKFIDFVKDGGMSQINKKTIMINFLKPASSDARPEDLLFLINGRDLAKGIYTRTSSISWNSHTKKIKVFSYDGVDNNNTIVFKEIQ